MLLLFFIFSFLKFILGCHTIEKKMTIKRIQRSEGG